MCLFMMTSGFEADDVIRNNRGENEKIRSINIIIASGDMDTMQLVDEIKIQVYTLKRNK